MCFVIILVLLRAIFEQFRTQIIEVFNDKTILADALTTIFIRHDAQKMSVDALQEPD